MAKAGGQIWKEETSGGSGGGDSNGAGRVPAAGMDGRLLGRRSGLPAERRIGGEDVPAWRSRAESRRNISQSRTGMVARTNRAARKRGILQRRNSCEDSGVHEAAQRTDDGTGSGGVFERVC